MKNRKLSEYYQFAIKIIKCTQKGFESDYWAEFTNIDGTDRADYQSKLTKGQWYKASEYLTRKLIPFSGYTYKVKEEYKKEQIIIIK